MRNLQLKTRLRRFSWYLCFMRDSIELAQWSRLFPLHINATWIGMPTDTSTFLAHLLNLKQRTNHYGRSSVDPPPSPRCTLLTGLLRDFKAPSTSWISIVSPLYSQRCCGMILVLEFGMQIGNCQPHDIHSAGLQLSALWPHAKPSVI